MRVWVTARLDGTEIKASVVASTEYHEDRTVSASVDVPEDDLGPLTEVLMGLLDTHGPRAERRAQLAAAKALSVAVDNGEVEV